MQKSIKTAVALAAVAIIVLLVAFKLKRNEHEVKAKVYHPPVDLAVMIQADTIRASAFEQAIPFLGSFSANREVSVASETTGKVILVGVQEGQHVVAGSLVARLDDGVLQAQLQSAKASFDNATNTLARYEQAPNGVTKLQIDNARTQIATDQAQMEQLSRQIRQYTITAPFSGIVTARNFDLGAIVSPGSTLATLTDISQVKLEVSVPEQYIARFKTGMRLQVKTDVYANTVFDGRVDLVASKADGSHNYTVKVIVPNNSQNLLKAGMYGSVTLTSALSHSEISIPRPALIGSSQHPQVYVVENGIAKIRDIQTGEGNARSIAVTHGLQPGEIIAVGGLVNLSANTKVAIK